MKKFELLKYLTKNKPLSDSESAFTNIYLTYFETLCYFAFRFSKDENKASDIVQDVMAKLWEQKDKINEIKSIKSYHFRSVYNDYKNQHEHFQNKNNYISDKRRKLLQIEMEGFEQ